MSAVYALGRILMLTVRLLIWITDLDDGNGSKDWRCASPSATKLAGYLMVLVGLWIIIQDKKVDAARNFLVTAGVTALFGRALWKAWLARNTWTSAMTASATYARTEQHVTEETIYTGDERGAFTDRAP